MSDGKVFNGKQAIEVGLVDGVSTFDELLNNKNGSSEKSGVTANELQANLGEEKNMNAKEIKAKFPEAYQAIKVEVESEFQAKLDNAKLDGAKAEQVRIQEIDAKASQVKGFDDIAATMKKDTTKSAQDFVNAVFEKQVESKTNALDTLKKNAYNNLVDGDNVDFGFDVEFDAMVEAYIEEKGCKKSVAMKTIKKLHPKAYADSFKIK